MDDLHQDTRIFNQNLDRAEAKIQQLQAQIDTQDYNSKLGIYIYDSARFTFTRTLAHCRAL